MLITSSAEKTRAYEAARALASRVVARMGKLRQAAALAQWVAFKESAAALARGDAIVKRCAARLARGDVTKAWFQWRGVFLAAARVEGSLALRSVAHKSGLLRVLTLNLRDCARGHSQSGTV